MSETVKEVSVSDRNDSTAREESCRTIEKESGVYRVSHILLSYNNLSEYVHPYGKRQM